MERRVDLSNVDLDHVAALIRSRSRSLMEDEIVVEPLLWMDNDDEWPRRLVREREVVKRPMSVGMRLSRRDRAAAEVIVYAGGWADGSAATKDEQMTEYVEVDKPSDVAPLLDRVVDWIKERS